MFYTGVDKFLVSPKGRLKKQGCHHQDSENSFFDRTPQKSSDMPEVAQCWKILRGPLCSLNALFLLKIEAGTSVENLQKKVSKCRKTQRYSFGFLFTFESIKKFWFRARLEPAYSCSSDLRKSGLTSRPSGRYYASMPARKYKLLKKRSLAPK